MKSFPPEELYYITHINSLRAIFEEGIVSHERIEQQSLSFTPVYSKRVVNGRKDRFTLDGKGLWHYANLYLQPRNPMMYSLLGAKKKRDLPLSVSRTRCFTNRVFLSQMATQPTP